MNAKELRIGNLIQFEGKQCTVKEINQGGAIVLFEDKEEIWIDIFQLGPIPLTEEWLVKLGFKYRTDTGYNGWYSTLILGESIRIFEIENKWFKYHYANPPIKYIHQLQNLYFALTGKELTLV